ncbi:hypothetical protein [Cellulomonas sp. P5_C5]
MSDYYTLESDGEAQNQVALSTQSGAAGNFVRSLRHRPGVRDSVPFLEWQMPTSDVFDWPWNSTNATLLSDRARTVLEPVVGVDDHVQWLPAFLLTPDGVSLQYWIAHLYEPLDIYHDGLTDLGPSGIPFEWTLSLSKAAGHHVFAPSHMSGLIILSAAAATAVRTANLAGTSLTACPSA